MHIQLDTNGIVLSRKKDIFVMTSETKVRTISPHMVKSFTVSAKCLVSSRAVDLASKFKIPIYYQNRTGQIYAKIGVPTYVGGESLRTKQVFYQHTKYARRWVADNLKLKMRNQMEVIRHWGNESGLNNKRKTIEDKIEAILQKSKINLSDLLVFESNFSSQYWKIYRKVLPKAWKMGSRNLRPAQDPVNSLINYTYGFLYKTVEHSIYCTGLNPQVGLLHKNRYNDPVLAYDLIEPFRPNMDYLVMKIINEGSIRMTDFKINDKACVLNKTGKRKIIPMIYDHMEENIGSMLIGMGS